MGKGRTTEKRMALTNDMYFRAVYGQDRDDCREALIALLNVVLDRDDNPITGLTYHDPFVMADMPDEKKSVVMDIKVETANKEYIDIEMQVRNLKDYRERSVFYQAGLLRNAVQKGEKYDTIKKTIMINFIHNGILFPDEERYHSVFTYRNDTGHELSNASEIHFIELMKVEVLEPDKMNEFERLCAYLRFAGDESMNDYVRKLIESGGEVIRLTEKRFREVTQEEHEWARKHSEWMFEMEAAAARKEAREEGLEEGRAEGRAEGRSKEKNSIARAMKCEGMDAGLISKLTGLSIEEIESL